MRPAYCFMLCCFVAGVLLAEHKIASEHQDPKASFRFEAVQDQFAGRVVGVSDGDTIKVLRDGKEVRVRLWGIDAPESKQPFGTAAKKRLSDLVFGKAVTVEALDVDRYGRTVGRVLAAWNTPTGVYVRACANEVMVLDGYAWWHERYAPDDQTLRAAQQDARAAKRGLWSEAAAVAPWDWRRTKQ